MPIELVNKDHIKTGIQYTGRNLKAIQKFSKFSITMMELTKKNKGLSPECAFDKVAMVTINGFTYRMFPGDWFMTTNEHHCPYSVETQDRINQMYRVLPYNGYKLPKKWDLYA